MTEHRPDGDTTTAPAVISLRARMTSSQRRGQLIDVATALFAERGYEGTSVEEIAHRARVWPVRV
jgi:AcrR family transcriptional regulator